MTHISTPLKQIDYFPLVSFYKQQGVSPFVRFLKPINECMGCFEAVKIGGKTVAVAGAFPLVLKSEKMTANVLYIGNFASMSMSDEFIKPLTDNLRKRIESSDADVILCDSPKLSAELCIVNRAYENIYTITRQSMGINDGKIKKVFAFVDLNVIMDEDSQQLKKVYASGVHYEIPDDNFRLSLTSHEKKPVIVKDSMGNVMGLMLTHGVAIIDSLFIMNPDDIPNVLRAYMIFGGLEKLQVNCVEGASDVCRVLNTLSEICEKKEGLFFNVKSAFCENPEKLFPMPI